MTRRLKVQAKAVGYIRVSTEEQADEGKSLDTQTGEIREWAAAHGFSLEFIHEDTASARGHDSLRGRPGLRAAIDIAQRTGSPIVVTSVDRLSRSLAEAQRFMRSSGVKVISIAAGGSLRPSEVLSQVADAERAGDLIAEKTKSGLARIKQSGITLGSPADKHVASKAAARVRQMKANEVVDHLRRFLQADRSRVSMNAPALVRELNAAGIRTGRNLPWTLSALRRPLRHALNELKAHDEMDAEVDFGPFAENRLPDVAGPVATAKIKPVEDSESHYKTNANYGRF